MASTSTVAPGLDNKFDSNIFALAFPAPKSNPLNGFADAFTGFGKAIEEGQAAQLERKKTEKAIELADETILSSQQTRAHNEKFNPLLIKDKEQAIKTNEQTFDYNALMNPKLLQSKTLEIGAKEIQNKAEGIKLGDQTVASQDAMQERELYAKLKPLKPADRTKWMPTTNDFYEWGDQKRSFSPAVVARMINKLDDEEREKEAKIADIRYKDKSGTAAMINANANKTSAGASVQNAEAHMITAKSGKEAAQQEAQLRKEELAYRKEKDMISQGIDYIKATKPKAQFAKPTADDEKRSSAAIYGIRQIDKMLSDRKFAGKVGNPINATLGRYFSGTMFSGESGDAYSDIAELAKSVNGSNKSSSGAVAELVSTYKDLTAGGFMGGDNIKNNLIKTKKMLIGRLAGEFRNVLAHNEGKRTEFMALTGIDPFAEPQTAAQPAAAPPPKQQLAITPTSKQHGGVPQTPPKPNQAPQPIWKMFDY